MSSRTGRRISRLALLAAAILLPAAAGATDKPEAWVRRIYDLYVSDKATGSATDLFAPEASDRLARLIKADNACRKKNGGAPCGLDFDVVANGQDYKIANVASYAVASADKLEVIARFTNFDQKMETAYSFVRKGGDWRLDEVMGRAPDGSTWRLTKLLGSRN